MAWGKRRKGKQGTGRGTSPVPPPNKQDETETTTPAPPLEDGDAKVSAIEETATDSTTTATASEEKTSLDPADAMVLPSEKRRGVYECDYCHSDISQLPRIRCAVCSDFDLCLDCFATTDHAAVNKGVSAASSTASELAADGIAVIQPLAASMNVNHDDTHGYRVCDSTRFPIFGPTRSVIKLPPLAAARAPASESGSATAAVDELSKNTATSDEYRLIVADDPKMFWTAEEDLRLLDAIKTHGLGNWTEIADSVGGNGSVGKTPKRCMERYFDDFLGRYGHILPQYTIVDDNNVNDEETASTTNYNNNDDNTNVDEDMDDESVKSSKRRSFSRLPSNVSVSSAGGGGGRSRKRFKVVPTESLPGYQDLWPKPYLPPVEGVEMGQEVARDLSTKNELIFVKALATAANKEEADKIRKEWEEKYAKQKIGAPTVLPPNPEDSDSLPGAELVGFMPRRGDFDIEYDNEAEQALADMEFLVTDTEQEKQLKLQVLQIYYQKQNEREKRKQFILSRNLYDYRKYVKNEQDLPQDERDLRHRVRLFERFHTPAEHKQFIDDIIKAKRLRKEIAKLQMYRRIGIRSLAEAEKYELDKTRRQFHKVAQLEKEAAAKHAAAVAAATGGTAGVAASTTSSAAALTAASVAASVALSSQGSETGESSLWKNYRDRTVRRSINRTGSTLSADDKADEDVKVAPTDETKDASLTEPAVKDAEPVKMAAEEEKGGDDDKQVETPKAGSEKADAMQVDEPTTDDKEKDGGDDEDNDKFDITTARGYDLLSQREAELCIDLRVYPAQYLAIKKALIQESLSKGLLEKEGPGSGRRLVVKLDIKRRGEIVDFMLRAGWISSRLAKVARTVTPPLPMATD